VKQRELGLFSCFDMTTNVLEIIRLSDMQRDIIATADAIGQRKLSDRQRRSGRKERKKKEERNKRTRTLAPRRRGEGKIRKDTKESNKASRRAQRAEVIKEKKNNIKTKTKT